MVILVTDWTCRPQMSGATHPEFGSNALCLGLFAEIKVGYIFTNCTILYISNERWTFLYLLMFMRVINVS